MDALHIFGWQCNRATLGLSSEHISAPWACLHGVSPLSSIPALVILWPLLVFEGHGVELCLVLEGEGEGGELGAGLRTDQTDQPRVGLDGPDPAAGQVGQVPEGRFGSIDPADADLFHPLGDQQEFPDVDDWVSCDSWLLLRSCCLITRVW